MTMEWALDVDIGIFGRRVGVHGPAVTMIVSAGRLTRSDFSVS